jgi:hypothetical protein
MGLAVASPREHNAGGRNNMRLLFFLSALLILMAICGAASAAGLPVAPFVVIIIIGEAVFGLHLNHNRPLRVLKALGHAMKSNHVARMRGAH